jgi:hypothetical protein
LDVAAAMPATFNQQPDIQYQPDYKKYQERTARRLEHGMLTRNLPAGFPQQLSSPLVWTKTDFKGEEWVTVLTEADQHEIAAALRVFQGSSPPLTPEE